ncbi:MAG: DNA repair protein RadC [Mogibacterium sp.]|nr:DNA repair protein RadC [Mogibacterium sp.]
MRISKMPASERPREKLVYEDASRLSTSELLAILIRTGSRDKSAVQLAEDVLSYCADYGGLGNTDVSELVKLEGIGLSKACSIAAGIELGKRMIAADPDTRPVIKGAEDAARILMNEFKYEKREHLVELILNTKGEVEAKITVSIGELSATSVHPREVFNPAIRKGAAGIIVAHNHPSGDPTPSEKDIEATRRLVDASRIIGIKLLDHIIIGNGTYTSLRAEGFIQI